MVLRACFARLSARLAQVVQWHPFGARRPKIKEQNRKSASLTKRGKPSTTYNPKSQTQNTCTAPEQLVKPKNMYRPNPFGLVSASPQAAAAAVEKARLPFDYLAPGIIYETAAGAQGHRDQTQVPPFFVLPVWTVLKGKCLEDGEGPGFTAVTTNGRH